MRLSGFNNGPNKRCLARRHDDGLAFGAPGQHGIGVLPGRFGGPFGICPDGIWFCGQ